jgi:hypothetical protein
LRITEDRAIFADVEMADIAATTFANAAFHPSFEGRINPFNRKSKGHQLRERELDHDGRAADHGVGVIGRRGDFL